MKMLFATVQNFYQNTSFSRLTRQQATVFVLFCFGMLAFSIFYIQSIGSEAGVESVGSVFLNTSTVRHPEALSFVANKEVSVRFASSKASKKASPKVMPSLAKDTTAKPKTGLLGNLLNKTTYLASNVKNSLDTSQTVSSYKSLCKTCNTLKTNIKNLFWSILVFFKLDSYLSPRNVAILFIIWRIVKGALKLFTIFNLVLLVWVFFFNTPVFTAKLFLGWIADFFKVAFETYKDYIAKFLDWIIKAADEGIKSVPKHPETPVQYPEGGFYKKYREIFQLIKDLPPKPDYGQPVPSRWYDFLRDKESYSPIRYLDPETGKSNTAIHNTFNFLKDNWHYFAIGTGIVLAVGLVWIFWAPITTGVVTVGSAIKTGVVAVGSAIKSGFQSLVGYFSANPEVPAADVAPDGNPGTAPVTPGMAVDNGTPVGEPGSNPNDIPLNTFTPGNLAGPAQLSDDEIQSRVASLRLPPTPTHSPSVAPSSLTYCDPQAPVSRLHTPVTPVVDLGSPGAAQAPLPPTGPSYSPGPVTNPWFPSGLPHNTIGTFNVSPHFSFNASPTSEVSQELANMGEGVAHVGGSGSGSAVGSGSGSSTRSVLGLEGVPETVTSTITQEAAEVVPNANVASPVVAPPVNTEQVVQNSPVLSQLNVTPATFGAQDSTSSLRDFPTGPRTFPGGFASPNSSQPGSPRIDH